VSSTSRFPAPHRGAATAHALNSSVEAKRQTLAEFEQELAAMGLTLSDDMEERRAPTRKRLKSC
jgi:chromosome condensin MukBEF ATPase and DNA-binding subunit MukB